ncbi:MAG: hypothetical protein CNLJKLNK_00227 [Holosporales bacterium]
MGIVTTNVKMKKIFFIALVCKGQKDLKFLTLGLTRELKISYRRFSD